MIQKYNRDVNVAIGTAVGVSLLFLTFVLVSPGALISLIFISVGALLADLLQGVHKSEETSSWIDENGQVYTRLTGDNTNGPIIPSELVIVLGAVLGSLIDVVFFGSSLLSLIIATPIITISLYIINIVVLRLITDPLNRRRLKTEARDLFEEQKNVCIRNINRAEDEAQKGNLTEDTIEKIRSYRQELNRIGHEYGVEQNLQNIDERLRSLELQLDEQQARERFDEYKPQVRQLIDRLQSAEEAGNYDRALNTLDELEEPLAEAENIREEYGFDEEFEVTSGETDQIRRSLVEKKYEGLLTTAEGGRQDADDAITDGDIERAHTHAKEAMQKVTQAKDLAEEWVFLSEQDCIDERESVISVRVKAIANQAAEIEAELQSRQNQEHAEKELDTLEAAVKNLEDLHQSTVNDGTQKDIVTTAGKVQTVLLAARLLAVEQDAQRAVEQFQQGDYDEAKRSFDTLVNRLDDIRDRTPDDALKEYESELNELQTACETNAERARKVDLDLEPGLEMESTDILGAKLRGEAKEQFEAASSGDTDVFDPSSEQGSSGDTQVFDPSNVESSGDTEVFDSGDSDN